MVKYEETTLVMDAWITNGFDYAVYNIHDVTLRISNEEGVIADAYFDELTDLRLEPGESVIWTFYFRPDTVQMLDADLYYLTTELSTRYNY